MIDLKAKPFYLDDDAIDWVERSIAGMTPEEKVGQLFCMLGHSGDDETIEMLTRRMAVGGVMYRPGEARAVQSVHRALQAGAKIPMLLAANLEAGGTGIAADGTTYGKPLQAAATGDAEAGYRLGKIACAEGAMTGCNWAFAPIVDIDMNFRNPITNLRTFGSDVDMVIAMARGYLRAADEEGVAVSIKHFPGDGVDERDQHLHITVNSLDADVWEATYGRVYAELIEAGAKTVMIGHIAQPAWARRLNPELGEGDITPATLSAELMQGLLRGRLGFNGLIVTDATTMLGFTTAMPREQAVPATIARGADMFLFTKNPEEDYGFMMAGYKSGVISEARMQEALTRILATKASLGLHLKQRAGTLVPPESALENLGNPQFTAWARQCADRGITLVKDTQSLLPLNPARGRRLLLNVLEPSDAPDSPLRTQMKALFEREGYEVTVRDRTMPAGRGGSPQQAMAQGLEAVIAEVRGKVGDFKARYDLVVYLANFETASNQTSVRIDWHSMLGMGDDNPWFVLEVPTLFVSLANPYHLLDVPMVKTYINAYTATPAVVECLMDKLMGRSKFTGISPVDPFCGRRDTAL